MQANSDSSSPAASPAARSAADIAELHEYLQHVRATTQMSMSDVVRRQVKPAGDTQHLTLPQLSKLESGRVRNPRFRTMVLVARAYGIDLNDLARYFNDPDPAAEHSPPHP
jgi:transcriptional regulator with XRE-family HTH domain